MIKPRQSVYDTRGLLVFNATMYDFAKSYAGCNISCYTDFTEVKA